MTKKITIMWPIGFLLIATLIAFSPVFKGNIPLNGRNLASFFSPWTYETWAGFPAGIPAKPGILDQLRIYYPYMRLTQESYRLGQLPLWNPYNFAGNPHMAEWQSGALYPLHILLPFLPLPVYWTLYQMIGIFLSALFTYWYLKNLRLDKLPSIFGGLTYSLSTFMFTWNAEVVTTPHSIMWLPLMLLAIDKYLSTRAKKYWILLIGGGTLSILSGYWQTTFYALATAGLYVLVRSLIMPPQPAVKTRFRSTAMLVSAFVFMAGLTAYQLLPTAQLYRRSSRQDINWSEEILSIHKGYLLKPYWLITLFAPDFFGNPTTRNQFSESNGSYYEWSIFSGTIALLLLPFLLLARSPDHRRLRLFFLSWGIIAGSFSFDLPHSRWVFDAHVPVLSTGIANRILYLPAFALAVLSSIGLNSWLHAKEKSRRRLSLLTILFWLGLIIGLWLFLFKVAPKLTYNQLRFPQNWYQVSKRNSVIPTAVSVFALGLILMTLVNKRWLGALALLITLGAAFQNLYQFHKFTPFSEPEFVYPIHPTIKYLQDHAGINRFIGYNGVFLGYNYATQFGIYTIEGYDSLNDKRRTQLFAAAQSDGNLSQRIHRSADVILDSNLANPDILRMLQLTGTKYFVDHPVYPDVLDKSSKPVLPVQKQKLVFEDGDWRIYEYIDAFPRAYLVGNYLVESDDQQAVYKIFDPSIDLRQTVVLSAELPLEIQPDPQAKVEVISYTPNKIVFQTQSATNQLLFLSDTYYPGWKATIDDSKPIVVLPGNFAFRAVPVPAGTHSIEMYYFPSTFTTGLIIAGITLILMLGTTKVVART